MAKGTDIYYISGSKKSAIRGAYMPDDLTADSEPDFDNWGPDDYWSCAAFLQWYKLMKVKYGASVAKQRFLSAWETAWTFGSYHQNCCNTSEFRNFMKSEGIDVDTLTCALLLPVVETAANTVQSASDLSKFIKNVAPWLLGGAIVAGGAWAINKYVYRISPKMRK